MNISDYNSEILPEYQSALEITEAYLRCTEREFASSGTRNPIKAIKSRLKTFESVQEKCTRKNLELTPDSIRKGIRDIAGIRIVCTFRDDIYTVFDTLRKMPIIMIVQCKDYVQNPKPSGYSSLHVIVSVPVPLCDSASKLVPLEIQIRDTAMDMWASVEHVLKYKNPNPDPTAAAKLRTVAEHLQALDEELIALRDYAKEET